MKTPEQIRDMEFQKGPMGGYKQSDVELFLEEVASQIEILTKQKNDAERKLQEMSKQAPEAALTATGIQNVLVSAQRVADQVIEDSKAEAERIVADANLKLAEADIKAREVISEAEAKAILLGETAETEAAKIIAAAVKEGETIVAEAKESIALEQKLYDRLKIEVADFRKKASQQCSALVELINQLPDDIPFNMERSKQVLSVDFSNPDELLKIAVEERLAKEKAEAEVETEPEVEAITEPVIEEVEEPEVAEEPALEPEVVEEEAQLTLDNESAVKFEVVEDEEEDEDEPFVIASEPEEPQVQKNHITFSDDDFDDEDDEPRLFFRRKKN